MKNQKLTIYLIAMVIFTALTPPSSAEMKLDFFKPKIRVGVFDSRAVACSWLRSKAFAQELSDMKAEYDKAKTDGNQKRLKELEEQAPKMQDLAHKQVFGNEPIDDVLERIQKQLPKIAAKNKVDILISKWEIAYQSRSAKFVDVTWDMVNLFDPDEETVGVVKEILKSKPVGIVGGQFIEEEKPKKISKRELNKIYKEFSLATQKDPSFNSKLERIVVTYDVHERLVDTFAYSFEHSLVSAFKLNGTEAVIVKPESSKDEKFEPDAAMHIDIQPLYRERKDGYQAIVGINFKVSLIETSTGKEVWQEAGKVDYIYVQIPLYSTRRYQKRICMAHYRSYCKCICL